MRIRRGGGPEERRGGYGVTCRFLAGQATGGEGERQNKSNYERGSAMSHMSRIIPKALLSASDHPGKHLSCSKYIFVLL
jgi:hypothetical protein